LSVEVYNDGDVSLNAGFWGQAWYQYVGDYDRDGDGEWEDELNDFMVYVGRMYVPSTATLGLADSWSPARPPHQPAMENEKTATAYYRFSQQS